MGKISKKQENCPHKGILHVANEESSELLFDFLFINQDYIGSSF